MTHYLDDQDELKHYGILRESGRYPWGSGKDEYQRSMNFYAMIDDLRNTFRKLFGMDMPEKEVAQAMGLTVAELRDTKTIAKEEIVKYQTDVAVKLKAKGVSINKISEALDGLPPPTVRLRLKNSENLRQSTLRSTADMIRNNVDTYKIVDIGKGTELNVDTGIKLGISPEKLRAAVSVLRDEGYRTYNLQVPQVGTKQFTNQLVIVPPGTTKAEARAMIPQIHTMGEWTENDGVTFSHIKPPLSVSSKRLGVVFREDGGTEQDGVIHVKPGVKDLSMGKNTYAQVRIKVDDTHYIKGMAIIDHTMDPNGPDIIFHTNKSKSVGKLGALKPLESDPDNPFGSTIKRQIFDDNPDKPSSALNIVNEPGDWEDWRKSLPSQMLAKQPHSLIKSQLSVTRQDLMTRLDEINSITNPVVKRNQLQKFAEAVDSDAVDLRAAAMPRQRTKVIMPVPKLNKTEVYAPDYETGESVVLIRYPHGGRFEIPEVTVNNNNRAAKKLLGDAPDAIGIHPDVAARLSGADFDGDTVVVIPNRQGLIRGSTTTAKTFEQLQTFDPKVEYGGYEEKDGKGTYKLMTQTGLEMGKITNLITDMSIQKATPEHIVRAVKHSMVVIDAEKHKLDYKKSEQQNNIKQLVELYQSHPESGKRPGGASTLLSQSTARQRGTPQRKLRPMSEGGPIDKETGALVYVPTGKTRSVYDKKTQSYKEERVLVTEEPKKGSLTDDAYTLVRDRQDPVENLYAEHTNAMKTIANTARLQADRIPNPTMNPRAKVVYAPEVDKLYADLNAAKRQKPLDRRAQVYANSIFKAKRQEDPLIRTDSDRRKKVERQALITARARLNLTKPVIEISDRQWDAIQSGAVSASKLSDILDYADPVRVMELAMPRTNAVMTSAVSSRAAAMLATGKSIGDVAAALGIPVGTLKSAQARGEV